MVDPETLEQGKYYRLKIRSRTGGGKIFDWKVEGAWGGRGMSAGGRINYIIVILPHTTMHYIRGGKDDILSAKEIPCPWKEVTTPIKSEVTVIKR